MPRGSRPGERRGGRKKGTPNKATLLKDAIVRAAATSDPNRSPLDIFLCVMRDAQAPLELRITMAQKALPFLNARPKEMNPVPPVRDYGYGDHDQRFNAPHRVPARPGRRVRIIPGVPRTVPGDDEADATPLGFLLRVMRDSSTPPQLQIRAAGIVAPFVHAKSTRPAGGEVSVEDQYGFTIELTEARALRDEQAQVAALARPKTTGTATTETQAQEATELDRQRADIDARISARIKSFGCPATYGRRDMTEDERPLRELAKKRRYEGLTTEEDAEEAIVSARLAAFDATPQGKTRKDEIARRDRLAYKKKYRSKEFSAEDRDEYERLCTLYPRELEAPQDPMLDPMPPMPDRSWLLRSLPTNR